MLRPLVQGRSRGITAGRLLQLSLCAVLIAGPVVVRLAGGGWPPVLALAVVGALLLAMAGPGLDGSDSFAHAQLTGGLVPLALAVAAAVGWRRPAG